MFHMLLLVLVLFSVAKALVSNSTFSCVNGICKTVVTIPHILPNATSEVYLHLWYKQWHPYALLRHKKPLALISPGALVQPEDYSTMATILAKRGFAVAVPEYSARALRSTLPDIVTDAIDAGIAAGYDCPKNGNFVTVRVVASISDFLANTAEGIFQGDTLLIGHSLGAQIATATAFGLCSDPPTPFIQDFFCEGVTDIPARMKIRILALFEGASLAPFSIPNDMVVIHAYSPYYAQALGPGGKPKAQEVREAVISGQERYLDVGFANVTNHFLPVNFQPSTSHSRTVCSFDRPPPEDKFYTTEDVQSKVIQSCVNVMDIVYFSFSRGLWMVRRMLVVLMSLPIIDSVYFLKV